MNAKPVAGQPSFRPGKKEENGFSYHEGKACLSVLDKKRSMRIKGITSDTGFINPGVSTKEKFEPAIDAAERAERLRTTGAAVHDDELGRYGSMADEAAKPLPDHGHQWDLFDFVATDAEYRSADIAAAFPAKC